eukprot:PITA_12028
MPTYNVGDIIVDQFLFNHVIARFGVPGDIVTDHGSHFRQHMMAELISQLSLRHDSSTPYYPQANDQLVYYLEENLPIECEIPSLKLAIELLPNTSPEEEQLIHLERLDETHRIAAMVIEAQKKQVKANFDQTVSPRTFVEGDLVLLYNQANDKLGVGKFKPMWHGPCIVKCVL